MESLSRHRHGRKHSATRNAFASPSFSLKDPYDDVSFSSGGKSKFGVHEYAEIFSGSSSIPVLDLSALDERVGSVELRSSRLDYSNIFGGLRNDEVAVPYEELLKGAAKRTKAQIPADARPPYTETGSLHSSGKTKISSGKATDQSVDVKQQFNMSFNKTTQRDSDESNGKTHIAELHAVPGFTCFVDGTPQLPKKEDDRNVSSLKREVSRTWSFNVGAVDGLTSEKSHIPDKPDNENEINLNSCNAEVLSPSSHPCNPIGESDHKGSRFPSFDFRDASERTAGEYTMSSFDEELDENSVAAVSAAALKKAVEQAQESIRIARMIMERKRENLQGGSKPRAKGQTKFGCMSGTGIGNEADGSIGNNAWEMYERLDTFPILTGINGKFTPSINHTGKFPNTGKAEVEKVCIKVETAKVNGDVSSEVGKRFAATCLQRALENTETVALNSVRSTGNGECRSEALEVGKVGHHDNLLRSFDKLQSDLEEMETVRGNFEWPYVRQSKEDEAEAVAELADSAPSAQKSVQEIGKSVDDSLVEIMGVVNIIKGAEDIAVFSERVLDSSQIMQCQEKIMQETGESLCIMQEEDLPEERDDVAGGKVKCGKKFLEHKEMVFGEHLTVRKSLFDNLLNGLRNVTEKDMENISETYLELESIGQHGERRDEEENRLMHKEGHLWFETDQQLKDSLKEEISEREPEIISELGGMTGKEQNCGHDGDGQKSTRNYEQYETVERQMDTSKFEAAETIQVEVNNCTKMQKAGVVWDAEETINIHRESGRSEENVDKFYFQDTASGKGISEDFAACDNYFGSINSVVHSNDTSNIISNIQESCEVDLNDKTEECQVAVGGCKENGGLTGLTDAFASTEDTEAEKLFPQEVNEMPGTDSLRRCASEENFIGSKLSNAFEGFSSDSSTENAGLVDADHEAKLQGPGDMFKTASKINNVAQEEAANIVMRDFSEFVPSSKEAEFDQTNVRLELEQTSESIDQTVSTSILEDMNGASAHDSQEGAQNAEGNTSKKEEVRHGLDMTSDGRENVEGPKKQLYSECQIEEVHSLHVGEPEEIEKSMETKLEVGTGNAMEKDMENLSEPSTMKRKDARGTWQKVETIDRQQRIEAIKKGREREKDRKAVERAIREARERAFAEAREKAERAAAERAAAEARHRVMAEAQEKLEKASLESKQFAGKLSTEAKIRAERAAVERATAEARERALEKAMSQKTYTEARTEAEKYSTERLSGSSRDKGLKHSFSSSDLEKFDETTSESAQRRKARLERHQRIMERAAKALAEKNKRDLLAQKEQAEKNRLAETLDAEIKRWAAGKEGNLRALLSTLQYILGPDSGWQPTSLTEIIQTTAVKKAYRKATLCVHPDKLQQRGATIQQKYICEKVFDLLKAAWNRFNSEEN